MKMKGYQKILMKHWSWLFFLTGLLFLSSVTAAKDKVVVIPLFDEKSGPAAPVPKTGQTKTSNTGDDGELEKGVDWPNPRFTDNGDGTVKDNLTGLIWLQNANCTSFFSGDSAGQNMRIWSDALTAANSLAEGFCGLTDGSIAGDWRLPNVRELESLISYGIYKPAVPNTAGTGQWTEGDPFGGLQSTYYWSSTAQAGNTVYAWRVYMNLGGAFYTVKSDAGHVWPVRSVKLQLDYLENKPPNPDKPELKIVD